MTEKCFDKIQVELPITKEVPKEIIKYEIYDADGSLCCEYEVVL